MAALLFVASAAWALTVITTMARRYSDHIAAALLFEPMPRGDGREARP